MIQCKEIKIEDKNIIDLYLKRYQPTTSELNFTNLFMWSEFYKFEYCIVKDVLWILSRKDDEMFAYSPILGKEADIRESLEEMKMYFAQKGNKFVIKRGDQRIRTLLGDHDMDWEEDRDNSDYIYAAQDLIELPGKKYHRKRNHIKQFQKAVISYEYVPLTEDLIDECLDLELYWCSLRDCENDPSLLAEQKAIFKALRHFSQLDISGGVIRIDGKVQAFTFGEKLNENTAVIHIEKANPDYHGLYTLINQKFCQHQWSDLDFVNREQDLGIPGLRKAKESYYPHHLENKYIISVS